MDDLEVTHQPPIAGEEFEVSHKLPNLDTLKAELARRSLRKFIEYAWPIVEPVVTFVPNWHIDALCVALEKVSRGEISRLIVNFPPGCMKSLIVSVFWPAWEWVAHPDLRYLTASYSDELTIRDNLKVRDIITSEWYRHHFPHVDLRLDANRKTRMDTTKQGWRIATSIGGRALGEHPDRTIIDDPLNPKQAASDLERQTANDWFDGTISTRGVARGVRIVVIMQRLHEDDLTGHLLAKGGWVHLCYPMRADPVIASSDDPRPVGQLLWPALFDHEKVAKLESDLGSQKAAGQLQQRPVPAGGTMVKEDWFRFYAALPVESIDWLLSLDCAFKDDDDSDYVCLGAWCRKGANIYLVDRLKEHLGLPGTITALVSFANKYPKALLKLVEDKANGTAVIQMLRSKMPGLVAVEPMGSKAARLAAVTPMIEAGNVYLPLKATTPWVADYIAELIAFPKGAHDDQVDMTSQALLRYHQRGVGISNADMMTVEEDDDASLAPLPAQF